MYFNKKTEQFTKKPSSNQQMFPIKTSKKYFLLVEVTLVYEKLAPFYSSEKIYFQKKFYSKINILCSAITFNYDFLWAFNIFPLKFNRISLRHNRNYQCP